MTVATRDLTQNNPTYRYWVLVGMVLIAGFSQGMLLPVLAVMLETAGVSSSANGINAAALYIGIILISPFIERPVRKFGYKPVIIVGLLLVMLSLILFPIWQTFWFWFVLRMVVGIGDNLIHFSTQIWISTTSSREKRGRQLAIYGLAFGMGFGIGPMMTRLIEINAYLPFIIAACTSFIAWIFMLFLRNEWPKNDFETASQLNTFSRYKQVIKLAWFALLPGLCYGFLEATLHGSYPVYAMRVGLDISFVTVLLLPSFVFGSLLTQLPLGVLSDKIGRSRVIRGLTFIGSILFFLMVFVEHIPWALWGLFAISGMLLGSLFSLGIAYLADLVPASLLPTGTVMTGILFALGSMIGPSVGGFLIGFIERGAIYYAISAMLLLVFIAGMIFERTNSDESNEVESVA
ncbi:MFS transporter [Evansella cellulosilytica]|uniref:Major facilitator superfamily MFS_1 n=1 Tax=Evansella cellulosilytica (strain ATCC 21833 / DSM 2522 / FERM P-1141 / JCM 9156 / N-4) TaxID=649639 RepID=E6U0M8_EVAC2|nr:MFS transporter [Evansella cellulosilytica]ADU29076.1 major facilitator superfamily MFS_1 [Evansella cellulosilytica DSM 2522]